MYNQIFFITIFFKLLVKKLLPLSGLLIFYSLLNIGSVRASEFNDQAKVEMGIIDFLYIFDGGYVKENDLGKSIENQILIPTITKELRHYNILDNGIKIKKMMRGNLDLFGSSAERMETNNQIYDSYDMLIWGLVLPLKWPNDYYLDLFVIPNRETYQLSIMHTSLRIKNERIVTWNNQSCDIPEASMAIIPSMIYYKMARLKNQQFQRGKNRDLNQKIKDRISSLAINIPGRDLADVLAWYPNKIGFQIPTIGLMEFESDKNQYLYLDLPKHISDIIERFLSTDRSSNWPLQRKSLVMPEITIGIDNIKIQPEAESFLEPFPVIEAEEKININILPLEDLNNNNQYNWVGFGIKYLLEHKFSKVSALSLINYSQEQYDKLDENTTVNGMAQKIGSLTDLQYGISGKYSTDGKKLTLDMSYIDAQNGKTVFTKRYEENFDELFNITDEIAHNFTQKMIVPLTSQERNNLSNRVTNSIQAYKNFCMGYMENERAPQKRILIINHFRNALNEDPTFWEAHYNLGTALFNLNDYDGAIEHFNLVITAIPKFAQAYMGRAITYLQMKEYVKAKSDLLTALNLNSDDYKPYFYLGKLNIILNDFSLAVDYLNRARELNPEFANTFFELGNVYYTKNKYGEAIPHYKKAVALAPENFEGHQRLGDCYYRVHNFHGAYDEYNYILQDYPNDPEANFMLGITLYKEASLNDFIDSFLELTGLENKNRDRMLSRSLNNQYEVFEEMIYRFYLAQRNRNNFYEATFNLAMTYQELNNLDSALVYYDKTVRINPSLVKAHLMMAKIYEKMNDRNNALDKYKDVVRVDPGLFEAYPNLGEIYGNLNVVEIVKKELEQEINQNPNDVEANLSLARIMYSRGFHSKAASIYRNVLSIHPENKRARRMLAQLEKGS